MRTGAGLAATVSAFAMAAASVLIARSGVLAEPAQRRPNFAEHVAPIIHANCTACHQPDRAAPFALLSYVDVQARGKEIREAVSSRKMPPWSAIAASGYPGLHHDRRLTTAQIATVVSWVDAGMPPGDLSKAPLPPILPALWSLGLPDLTVSLPRPVSIPADSLPRAFNVVLYLNYPVDRWIQAIDYMPTSRGLLSHAVIFSVPSTMVVGIEDVLPGFAGLLGGTPPSKVADEMAMVDRSIETIGVWTPQGRRTPAPDGSAIHLRKNSNIVLQFHSRAADTGAIEDGATAIYFSKQASPTPLTTLQMPSSFGIVSGLDIPADQAKVVVRDEFVLPVDVKALGARGHAHELGQDFKMTARLPNGTVRGLLWIDRWTVMWQETYYFKSEIALPKGTRIQVEITYDNSATHPRNSSASPRRVGWGTTLADEIGAMDLLIAAPSPADEATLAKARAARFREQLLKKGRP